MPNMMQAGLKRSRAGEMSLTRPHRRREAAACPGATPRSHWRKRRRPVRSQRQTAHVPAGLRGRSSRACADYQARARTVPNGISRLHRQRSTIRTAALRRASQRARRDAGELAAGPGRTRWAGTVPPAEPAVTLANARNGGPDSPPRLRSSIDASRHWLPSWRRGVPVRKQPQVAPVGVHDEEPEVGGRAVLQRRKDQHQPGAVR